MRGDEEAFKLRLTFMRFFKAQTNLSTCACFNKVSKNSYETLRMDICMFILNVQNSKMERIDTASRVSASRLSFISLYIRSIHIQTI